MAAKMTSTSSSTGGVTGTMTGEEGRAPSVYEMRPPRWRPRFHPGSRALGVPDLYARHADDPPPPEDELSEANVKNGLNTRPAVGNETFSAHDMIYDRLKGKSIVQQLGSLFDEVVQRREMLTSLRCGPVASQYRHPQRVTLNEVKLAAYVKELADPSVPLRKLARSVPHGYRGERMLDMLWNGGSLAPVIAAVKTQQNVGGGGSAANANHTHSSTSSYGAQSGGTPNSVAIERAVWFVRVVGASEISSSRLRQGKSGAYTAEWTSVLMGWLRRQVVELNIVHHHQHQHHNHYQHLNSAANSPAPASPHSTRVTVRQSPSQSHSIPTPQRFEEPYALILEDDFRQRWSSKWNYSLSLLRALMYENLVDVQVAARIAIEMLRTANVAQIFVVLALTEEFLGVIVNSVTLSAFAVEVFSAKLFDSQQSGHQGKMNVLLCKEIESVLSYCFEASPDTFLMPSCWRRILPVVQASSALRNGRDQIAMMNERNELLLDNFAELIEQRIENSTANYSMLQDVQTLDSLMDTADIKLTFETLFQTRDTVSLSAADKVRAILLWSTSRWRTGTFRQFAGATLLQMYSQRQPSRTSRRIPKGTPSRPELVLQRVDLDAIITNWIADVDTAQQSDLRNEEPSETDLRSSDAFLSVSIRALIILVGELCRRQCFSFQKYLQRLTARGLTAMGGRDERQPGLLNGNAHLDSLHTKVLRSVPLLFASAPLEHQRRIAIYGNRTKESWEEAMERRALREIQSALPWIWHNSEESVTTLSVGSLSKFWSSSRHVRSRIIHRDILPGLKQYCSAYDLSVSQFRHLIAILVEAEDFAAVWQVLDDVEKNFETSKDATALQAFHRFMLLQYRLIWIAMGTSVLDAKESNGVAIEDEDSEKIPIEKMQTVPSMQESQEIVRTSLNDWQSAEADKTWSPPLRVSSSEILRLAVQVSDSMDISSDRIAQWIHRCILTGHLHTNDVLTFLRTLRTDIENGPTKVVPRSSLYVAFIKEGVVTVKELISELIIPFVEEEDSERNDPHQICLIVDIAAYLFHEESANGEEEELVWLSSATLSYLNDTSELTTSQLLRLVGFLAELKERATVALSPELVSRAQAVQSRVTSLEVVRIRVQKDLFKSIRLIRRIVSPTKFHEIVAELLPSRWPWSNDAQLTTQMGSIFDALDALRWEQVMCELSVVLDSLQQSKEQVNQSTHNGAADSQFNVLARLMSANMLKNEEGALTKATLKEFKGSEEGAELVQALLEERIKTLNVELEATFTDEGRVRLALMGVLHVFQVPPAFDGPVAPTNACLHCLRLVTEWFENHLSTVASLLSAEQTVDELAHAKEERKGHPGEVRDEDADEILALHMSIVCMLLKFNNLLHSTTSAKALGPRLFCAMLHLVLLSSRQDDESEARLMPALDVITYLLQQASTEVQQAMQARGMEQIGATLPFRPCPMQAVADRIARLLNFDSETLSLSGNTAWRPPLLVEAQSTSGAFLDGQCTPILLKPWELHPNLDVAVGQTADGTAGGQQHQIASQTELSNLSNNGPISLHHFGAHRTLDRMPSIARAQSHSGTTSGDATPAGGCTEAEVDEQPPSALMSKTSYGLHVGGDTVYARDVQRGLLAMHYTADDGLSVRHLVPALRSKHATEPAKEQGGEHHSQNDAKQNSSVEKDAANHSLPSPVTSKKRKPVAAIDEKKARSTASAVANSTARKRAKK